MMTTTDRPVCTVEELAALAVAATCPPGTVTTDQITEILNRHVRNILTQVNRGYATLDGRNDGTPPRHRQIMQSSAWSWWKKTFRGLPPPALIAKIIEPAPISDPYGDFSLNWLVMQAQWSGWDVERAQGQVLADAQNGTLPLGTRCITGAFLKQSKVTRQAAFDWLRANGCEIPVDIADLAA